MTDLKPAALGGNPKSQHYAPAYLRRLARSLVLRAALKGRVSWHVALPLLDRIGGAA